jgi:sigma-B regulation protein RsbU (phosphoserine phosphatase)
MHTSIIHNVPMFSTLPESELRILAAGLKEVFFPEGTYLFREGEYGDKLYIIIEGKIAVFKSVGTGNENLLGFRSPGDCVGEMSLFNRDGLRTTCALTRSNVRLFEMTRASFNSLLRRQPTISFEMLSVLSGRLKEAHSKSIRDLEKKNTKLLGAYTDLKTAQDQIIEIKTLERELDQARKIQESMLPKVLPQFDGFEIGARMVPARMVGGDFFDVIQLGPEHLGVVVGDVSGKGIPAALFMALTRSLLHAEARDNVPPVDVLKRVNRHLLGMNADDMFVTILYGVLDTKTREFSYVRAGHEPLILSDDAGRITPIEFKEGQMIGLFPNPILNQQSLILPKGSTMLLFTDGATDGQDCEKAFFGIDGLESEMPKILRKPAQELCDSLINKLEKFQCEGPQVDDITLVAVKSRV